MEAAKNRSRPPTRPRPRWIGTTLGCTGQVVLLLLALFFGNLGAYWGWASSAPSGGPYSALYQTRSNWFCSASFICVGGIVAIMIWMLRRASPYGGRCKACGSWLLRSEVDCPWCSKSSPKCRVCEYPLADLPPTIAVCPECGEARQSPLASVDGAAVPGWFWRGLGCAIQVGLLLAVVVTFFNLRFLGWGPWLALTVVSAATMVGISVASMLRDGPDTVCSTCGYAFLVRGKPCPQCAPRVAMKIDWCEACGYPLEGLPFGRGNCPECGVATFRAADT